MIVRDTDTVKKYVSINSGVTYETLEPYIRQSERKFIKPLIGEAQYVIFDVPAKPSGTEVGLAWDLAQESICALAMYLALPIVAVQITEAGIFTASNAESQVSSDAQFKELQRSFKKQGLETLDEMLKEMEAAPAKFTAWTADDSYKSFTSFLVTSTATFNKHYNIFNSRQTFVAMKPEMAIAEKQFLEAPVQKALLVELRKVQTVAERKEVKELLQQAIVCFTISKVVENGLFVLDASGIHVRFDVLPYEKVNSNLKINDFLVRTRKNKISEGEQFLKQAMAIITDNLTKFTEYVVPTETVVKQTVHVTKGVTLL